MKIKITGASEHNLKNIDVEINDGLTVVTGVSGSGKSSLVFDTLYHESRRQFTDIFSPSKTDSRMQPARVESITGAPVALAVGQNLLNRNPNSTVATASGLHPFLRLLYSRFGEQSCTVCGSTLRKRPKDEIIQSIVAISKNHPVSIFIRLLDRVPGSHTTLLSSLVEEFPVRNIRVDGKQLKSNKISPLSPGEEHTIDIFLFKKQRNITAVFVRKHLETAQSLGMYSLYVSIASGEEAYTWADACVNCGTWYHPVSSTDFNQHCPHCSGNGCVNCRQTGLLPRAASVKWFDKDFKDIQELSVASFSRFMKKHPLSAMASRLGMEINKRVAALCSVGLGYVDLNRPVPSLSRGEAQRLRIAVILTGNLEDMLHILDEPSIGQHPENMGNLIKVFRSLKGPTVFVEHDRIAASLADRALDMGPGAGKEGGRLLSAAPPESLWKADSLTGKYFSYRTSVSIPGYRQAPEKFLEFRGIKARNLKNIDIHIPLGRITVITGVSGSGKSTLLEEVIIPTLEQNKPVYCRQFRGKASKPLFVDQSPIGRNPRSTPLTYTGLAGTIRDFFSLKTGLTPSLFSPNTREGGCPVCKGLGALEVKMHYLPPEWVECEDCGGKKFSSAALKARVRLGDGDFSIADVYAWSVAKAWQIFIEKKALPDKLRKKALPVLRALLDIGLGYLELGQTSPTLSGGEAQRIKLSKFLGSLKISSQLLTNDELYLIIDEPSSGLHPADISGLLVILDRMVRKGVTVIIVEHDTDIIRAADWVVDLGPGAGEEGGQLIYEGPFAGLMDNKKSLTGSAIRNEKQIKPKGKRTGKNVFKSSHHIEIKKAYANNLKNITVNLQKGGLTVITGVSGSGKSSLVRDILETEARKRFYESLSMYERQGVKEGPEISAEEVRGIGVTFSLIPSRARFNRRLDVGKATGIIYHLANLFAVNGIRHCVECGSRMSRGEDWVCPKCHAHLPVLRPENFHPTNYEAACPRCHGIGSLQVPAPEKLIISPEKPLCGGAMYSPGFFPYGYLCKPYNGGYDVLQGLARKYGFDPHETGWNDMPEKARKAFLFGDSEPFDVVFRNKKGQERKVKIKYKGFYEQYLGQWDVGGTFTDTSPCPVCKGSRLRKEYDIVTLYGTTLFQMRLMPVGGLGTLVSPVNSGPGPGRPLGFHSAGAERSAETIRRKAEFLENVGLGYLHMDRVFSTLSAGESQRISLSGLLGNELTSLTILMDEPSRGLHPSEVTALASVLKGIASRGNTVICVEHDREIIRKADYIYEMGPGSGSKGGKVVAKGTIDKIKQSLTPTGKYFRNEINCHPKKKYRKAAGFLRLEGACENNLKNINIDIPLGILTGICGKSGSGKSTLIIDTLGRILCPKKHTTSVAFEPIEPGSYSRLSVPRPKTIIVDQSKAGISSPYKFLALDQVFHSIYAESGDAAALGLDKKDIERGCQACRGRGFTTINMGFLPDVHNICEACDGSGYSVEMHSVKLRALSIPSLLRLTLDEVAGIWADEPEIMRVLEMPLLLGLGYLVLNQPWYSLSGGECQRLKMALELNKKKDDSVLFILDEPTYGLHARDVSVLVKALNALVDSGNSVIAVEHNPFLLCACDWLIELGPGGGPEGGKVIATGTPAEVAGLQTPISSYLAEALSLRKKGGRR